MPGKILTDEQRKYLARKGWTEEMIREYQRSGKSSDPTLNAMIEEVKPFETLESGVKYRDRRKTS